MNADADCYEAYYTDKLWSLLPAVYRTADAVDVDDSGPLRELVERIAVQAAVVRRSIDRLWEDQSIETCDDWVIPYIAQVLATNLVPGLDARGQRLDVAKTIYYRRRKGTVAVLEEIAHDITGWDARVVEFFRRLGRARHGLDPEIGWPLDLVDLTSKASNRPPSLAVSQGLLGRRTGTAAGGFADLRDPYGASRAADTAFDESSHTVDVRRGEGRQGLYNTTRLGVFVWRLLSVPISGVVPVPYVGCSRKLTFDPTGREIALFAVSSRPYGDTWVSPEEAQLPTPIERLLLAAELRKLYAGRDASDAELLIQRAIGVYDGEVSTDALVGVDHMTGDLRAFGDASAPKHAIDPERGVLYLSDALAQPSDPTRVLVSYASGFSSTIGAGAYDRSSSGILPTAATPVQPSASGGALTTIGSSGTLEILDSRTYDAPPDVTVAPGELLVLKAGPLCRPLLRFAPVGSTASPWTFTGGTADMPSSLWLDGLFISGGSVVLEGEFDTVTLSSCTLDPGSHGGAGFDLSADGRQLVASHLRIAGHVKRLVVDRLITGPIGVSEAGMIDTLVVEDSIVQALAGARAIQLDAGLVELTRATVLGPCQVHQLEASDSILHGQFDVADAQHGCVRFCACTRGGALPRRYECVEITMQQSLFTSRSFGDPAYAQLLDAAPSSITEGAEDGSEMGAFSSQKNSIKERGLLLKLREYMPVGLAPVVIHVT